MKSTLKCMHLSEMFPKKLDKKAMKYYSWLQMMVTIKLTYEQHFHDTSLQNAPTQNYVGERGSHSEKNARFGHTGTSEKKKRAAKPKMEICV